MAAEACARSGKRSENVIAAIAKALKQFKRAGLPLPKWAMAWGDPAYKQQLQQKANESSDRPGKGRHSTRGHHAATPPAARFKYRRRHQAPARLARAA